ncbi:MAG: c-type cytochrome [Nitrospirae bacterium]|nr:c-type cytochrome [Nitrospirota bacterium]
MSRVIAVLIAFALVSPAWMASARADAGKDLFLKGKCDGCHSVKAEKIEKQISKKTGKTKKGPDLSGVGLDHDAAWIVKWLKKEQKKDSRYKKGTEVKHKKKFKGTEEELKGLADWLALKKTKIELSPEEEGVEEEGEEEEKE